MRIRWICVLAALVALVLAGCTHRVYTIGVGNPENPRELPADAKLAVKKLPSRPAFEYDAAIAEKLTRLLEQSGYRTTAEGDADYLLLYDYRISDKNAHMNLELFHGSKEGMRTVRRGGPYVHVLEVRLVEAAPYRDNHYNESLIWEGGAVVGDVPTASQRFSDMLVVAAVERIGELDIEGTSVKMSLNDEEARRLRE